MKGREQKEVVSVHDLLFVIITYIYLNNIDTNSPIYAPETFSIFQEITIYYLQVSFAI